jgi:hypothetical protein
MSSIPKNTAAIYPSKTSADGSDAPYRLVKAIISRSVADTWHEAKREWKLVHIFFTDVPGNCLCGHPINEHCVLYNRENGNEVIVGNVCVTKFLGLASEDFFAALRRIKKNPKAALNAQAIEYAHSKGWLTKWERDFCLNTCGKRQGNLSPKQLEMRMQINALVLYRVSAQEGRDDA